NNRAVLGVQGDHAAMLAHHAHGPENGGIVDHHRVRVGHEHFEAAHALVAYGDFHVFEHVVIDVRDDHVKAVIDAGFIAGGRLRAGYGFQGGGTLVLKSKINNGCRAAERSRL